MQTPLEKLRQIQESDDKTKLRWVIILSAATIAIVLFLWVAHVSSIISSTGSLLEPQPEESGTPQWIQTLRLKTANTILFFREKISQKKQIIIESEN